MEEPIDLAIMEGLIGVVADRLVPDVIGHVGGAGLHVGDSPPRHGRQIGSQVIHGDAPARRRGATERFDP